MKKDVNKRKEFGTRKPPPSEGPQASASTTIEGSSGHEACAPPGTHLSTECWNPGSSFPSAPLGSRHSLRQLPEQKQTAEHSGRHDAGPWSAVYPGSPFVLMPTRAQQPVWAGPWTPHLGVPLLERTDWQARLLGFKTNKQQFGLCLLPPPRAS